MITIIGTGISFKDIPAHAVKIINAADVLIGGVRHLNYFQQHACRKYEIKCDIKVLISKIKKLHNVGNIVVLASGDPNFYGIASVLYTAFPRETIKVIPNITAFQAAFARMKKTWNDASFISIHGRALEALDRIFKSPGTYVVYCDALNSPARAAKYILEKCKALSACKTWIFDGMGEKEEKRFTGTLSRAQQVSSSALSLMIIDVDRTTSKQSIGIPDSAFLHQRGMITKRDVRLIALSRLLPADDHVLWDIGAGSGSLSIETANLYPSMKVYALEKHTTRYNELRKNIDAFGCANIVPVFGCAPEKLKTLPQPHSVFIGGSGGELNRIMALVKRQIHDGGHIVINCITMDTFDEVRTIFRKWLWRYDITALQISQLSSDIYPEIFRSENQIFIVDGYR